jgi:hypothetical protein
MTKQQSVPNPLHLWMLGWAIMAYPGMLMFGIRPAWLKAQTAEEPQSSSPSRKGDDSTMTAEEGELLLHLVD